MVDKGGTCCYNNQAVKRWPKIRGYSSAGRALEWHSRGQRFDPAYLHQKKRQIRFLWETDLPFYILNSSHIEIAGGTGCFNVLFCRCGCLKRGFGLCRFMKLRQQKLCAPLRSLVRFRRKMPGRRCAVPVSDKRQRYQMELWRPLAAESDARPKKSA